MNILMAHNFYREAGGEDESFKAEADLLQSNGCTVSLFTRDNHDIPDSGLMNKLKVARQTIWSEDSFYSLREQIRQTRPQVVHFQNTFPLISPSTYQACRAEGVPIVQSLRNYRLLCPNALFSRDNRPCEDCLGKGIPWPGVWHACYRDSRAQSAVVAAMLTYHRWAGTWQNQVDVYVALSEFSRRKFMEGGLPPEKIVVKPNFVVDRGRDQEAGDYVVFVGRLSKEKGILTLLNAWRNLATIPLTIIGTGPLDGQVREMIEKNGIENVRVLGYLPNLQTVEIIRRARFLVFPTELYETFGRVVVEAYSLGVPVVASRIGAVAELIQDKYTGLLIKPGDPMDLASKVEWLWTHLAESKRMGANARKVYEEKYTPEQNFRFLMEIYDKAINAGGNR